MQKEVSLPVPDDSIQPSSPDLSWLRTMLVTVGIFIFLGWLIAFGFSRFVLANISLQKEIELFGGWMIDDDMIELDRSLFSGMLDEVKYKIYVSDENIVNAYAVVGGDVIVTRGLLEEAKYLEEILFVIGHEIGHIEERHVFKGLLLHAPFVMTLQILGIDVGFGGVSLDGVMSNYFSQNLENDSDKRGVIFLENMGLPVGCATGFFEAINTGSIEKYTSFLSTHPVTQDRIEYLSSFSNENENCTKFSYNFD